MSHSITILRTPLLRVREITEISYEFLKFIILVNEIWIEPHLGMAESDTHKTIQEWHKIALNTDPQTAR